MEPENVNVILLDGHTHQVASRTAITISEQTGPIVPVSCADPNDPEVIIVVEGRASFAVASSPGHRFTANCGLSFDAVDANLDGDPRFDQNAAPDCPSC